MTKPRYKWTPLRRAYALPPSEALIQNYVRLSGMTREEAIASLDDEEKAVTIWKNDIYQVSRRDLPNGWVHLNIRRVDGGPVLRDWRHFQQIKNELLGDECEAIEMYPAESRKVDTSNKYHLIGHSDPTFSEVELCKVFLDSLERFKGDLKSMGLSEEDADKAMCLFGAGLESIHNAALEKAIEANRHLANLIGSLIKKNPLPESAESHQA